MWKQYTTPTKDRKTYRDGYHIERLPKEYFTKRLYDDIQQAPTLPQPGSGPKPSLVPHQRIPADQVVSTLQAILKSAATTTRSQSKQDNPSNQSSATQADMIKEKETTKKGWCRYYKRDHAPKNCTYKEINKEIRKSSMKVRNGRRVLGMEDEDREDKDKDFQVVNWISKEHLKDAYVYGMTHYPIWKDIYIKKITLNNLTFRDGFLYGWSHISKNNYLRPMCLTHRTPGRKLKNQDAIAKDALHRTHFGLTANVLNEMLFIASIYNTMCPP